MTAALDYFHPSISRWFSSRFDAPTAVQCEAWPQIASGGHVLITAPTGSGKTLTAFLWSLNRFAVGDWTPGRTRVLYVSPLKALNNDIQRNLLVPLQELSAEEDFPDLQVRTRSGDTPQHERQKMLRKPPDILITTPESLANLLTTTRGRLALQTIETVILDEVHSLIDNRRGVSLLTSIERLVDLCGELQRIALSATINPLEAVARHVAGFNGNGQARPISIVNPRIDKALTLQICYPDTVRQAAENGISVWEPLGEHFRDIANHHNSTLFFTNSRAMAEKITLKINEQAPALLAYAHHGSLARDIRTEVEKRLKDGELRAIVATSSLEMGIDIGSLDLVVLLQSPPGIAATLQRIGRAGHSVGSVSRGVLFPVHSHDFLEAAALAKATEQRDLEPLLPSGAALDVLAQIIVSMCASERWHCDDVYQLLKRSAPYNKLAREQFDLVLELLAGRYSGARVRELQARISWDRINNTVSAKKSAVFALYSSGGTIPDRGYYTIRHESSGARIGELDEEFVWEAKIGDTFTLGTQHWQVRRITHNDVLVSGAKAASKAPPFWRSERNNRSHHYSMCIGEFLEHANTQLDAGKAQHLLDELQQRLSFDLEASTKLIDYLQRQRESSNAALPSARHLLIEQINSGPGGYRGPDMQQQVVLHNIRGGRVNQPLALALTAAWQQEYNERPQVHTDNDAIIVQTTLQPDPDRILSLVNKTNVDRLLRQSLEGSGFFGARFRECAGRFMLLPRYKFNQRLPLWMSRLQAKKIFAATSKFDDFPVMLETWRTCLQDEFDMPALYSFLEDLAAGRIEWTHVKTAVPSPFAANLAYDQINEYMYADDTPDAAQQSTLSDELIKSAIADSDNRPRLSPEIVEQFIAKRQRTHTEYAPADINDWMEWLKERILMPAVECPDEFSQTCTSIEHLVRIELDHRQWYCHAELAHTVMASGLASGAQAVPNSLPDLGDHRTALDLAIEVLSFYGPLTSQSIEDLLPCVPDGLLDHSDLLQGELIENDSHRFFCHAENFEIMLRWQRAARRPTFEPLPASRLPHFLADWQNFGVEASEDSVLSTLDQLRGYSAGVQTVLQDTFNCRLTHFSEQQLTATLQSHEVIWLGTGKQKICFCAPEDLELLQLNSDRNDNLSRVFKDPLAGYSYDHIATAIDGSTGDSGEGNAQFWDAVWNGDLLADSLMPLQQGLQRNFAAATTSSVRQSRRRLRASRASYNGNWKLVDKITGATDAITDMENNRERVHLLLERYGLINRDLCEREGGVFRWRFLFRALRVMELSGEVMQGLFYNDLSGPQFISPRAFTRLQQQREIEHFWCNATDPVSPCGLGLKQERLPQRRVQNFLAWYRGEIALTVENLGRRLHFAIEPDHAELPRVLDVCCHIARSRKKLTVDTINDNPASQSPYLAEMARVLNKRADHKSIYFEC